MLLALGTALAIMLLDWPERLWVIAPLALVEVLEISLWLRLRRQRATTGEEGLIGARGRAVTDCHPEGQVRVRGALWRARCPGGASAGDDIEITAMHGLRLEARRVDVRAPRGPEEAA
jgi:membrane protein implicated in regulation of membrane protease activity